MDTNFEEKIRERAYAIWLAAGMTGVAHEHWCSAEAAVLNETIKPEKAIAKRAPRGVSKAAAKAAPAKAAPKTVKAAKAKGGVSATAH